MNLETRMLSSTDFLNSVPNCVFSSYTTPLTDLETNLIKSILQDDKDQLINLSKQLLNYDDNLQTTTSTTVSTLLQLCCNFDSVNCATSLVNGELGAVAAVNKVNNVTGMSPIHVAAESHAGRCVEMLLKKHARTDVNTKDGRGQLPLELCLSSSRMDVIWNPDDYSIGDLLVMLSEKDLTTVKLLCENTKEIDEVAYASAVGGRIVALAALLIVAAEKVNKSILVLHDGELGSKQKTTIYECVIREALSLGCATTPLRLVKRGCIATKSESAEKRKLLLSEIELLQLFGDVADSSYTDKNVAPLILAAQAGDEAVIEILLKSNIDINDANAEGNTALHFSLKTSMGSCQHVQQNRIVELLLKHGAQVSQRNKLGLTALHIAAANGNSQALEVLILEEPDCINSETIMKETPLFFAVKNDHMDCSELLLSRGANSEVLNLRQRPIDLAKSQEMRFLLNAANICHVNRAFDIQQKYSACLEGDEVPDTCETLLSMTDEGTNTERICSSIKTEVCKYFESPRGCIRGDKCFYAHGDLELQKMKLGAQVIHSPSTEEFKRKIFVGGLPPSLDSDSLGGFMEEHFGSVENATVVGFQTPNQKQSRGFGFVTFVHEESVSAAVQARYVTIMDKQVELKSAVPKYLLLAQLQEHSAQQQETDIDDQSQPESQMPEISTANIKEEMPTRKFKEIPCRETAEDAKLEQMSWDHRLQHGQPKTYATECQAHVSTSFENQNMPKWLRTFRKWLPRFLKYVYKHSIEEEYALSSLKEDFRATCHLELDHASLGYSKLSDFMRTFSDICSLKARSISKNGSPNHMVLLPRLPGPKSKVLQPLPRDYLSSPVTSIGDSGDSDSNHSKCPQYLQSTFSECGGFTGSSTEGSPSHEVTEADTAQNDTSATVNSDPQSTSSDGSSRFLQFLEKGSFSITQTPLSQGDEGGSGDPNDGAIRIDGSEITERPNRHLVLEWLARKWGSDSRFFVREFDFYNKYKASLSQRKCFGCNKRPMEWANNPCKHLLWCDACAKEAEREATNYKHKCVLCDMEVKQINNQPVYTANLENLEEFPPLRRPDGQNSQRKRRL